MTGPLQLVASPGRRSPNRPQTELVPDELVFDDDINHSSISTHLSISKSMFRVYYLFKNVNTENQHNFFINLIKYLLNILLKSFCVLQLEDILDCRAHKPIIPYHVRCSMILKKLGYTS
jgi:hypothetical protein